MNPSKPRLRAIVVDELNRLSNTQRQAVVLCDLEELTHEQAAAQLGWPVGTVKSRLARGRERLKSRLIRRGLAPSVGLIGAAVLSEPVLAAHSRSPHHPGCSPCLGGQCRSICDRFRVGGHHLSCPGGLASHVDFQAEVGRVCRPDIERPERGRGFSLAADPGAADASASSRGFRSTKSNADDDAIWARHAGNLKRIGLAMHNYQSAKGHFPAAAITGKDGKPLLSWRVAILPYLEDYDGHMREDLYKAFRLDEPWDSPHNKALLSRMPAVFASPRKGDTQPFTTVYRGFVSPTGNGKEDAHAGEGGGMSGAMGMAGMMGVKPGAGVPGGMSGMVSMTGVKPGAGVGSPGGMPGMGMAAMMGGAQADGSAPFGSRTFFRATRRGSACGNH